MNNYVECFCQTLTPYTFNMQKTYLLSHLIVTVPSISASQEQSPPKSKPFPPFANKIQLVIYLKFLLVLDSFVITYVITEFT